MCVYQVVAYPFPDRGLQLDRNLSGAVLSALNEVESGGVEPDQTDSLVELVSTSVRRLLQLPASSNEITPVAQVSKQPMAQVHV